jgi:hypothetical protein
MPYDDRGQRPKFLVDRLDGERRVNVLDDNATPTRR